MKTPRGRVSRLIAEQTLKGASTKQLSRELAAYLLQERRVSELDSILRDVQYSWAEAGFVQVIATSAHPLTAEIKTEIERQARRLYPGAKRVMVSEEHDPEVIGGVRLSLADRQWD
ncbi:MAG TPA: F0F1 ATP synthase subunit delta, partial [Candidatus Saccharimonadales bacterium]|nr:F0F1 ATP synthase subunit delta [Candidatus Saccharimonadales bacterium]